MQYLKYFFLSLIVAVSNWLVAHAPFSEEVLSYIQTKLPLAGVLKKSGNFVYVAVDKAYVHKLIALIHEAGFEEPPYFADAGLVGAHITVINEAECLYYNIKDIPDCGKIIQFTPKNCQIIHLDHPRSPLSEETDELYLIVVDAPELHQIREKYRLPPAQYDFHITIGVKLKTAQPA